MNINGKEIPQDIINAAVKIDVWMKMQGIEKWELCNICSRNYAIKVAKTERLLADIFYMLDK